MRRYNMRMYLMAALFALMLSACGGGSGGGGDTNDTNDTNNTTVSSNWDEMKWDQGQWK